MSVKIKIELKVIPNSSRSEIKREKSSSLVKVYLHSPREKGRANEELYELWKKAFKPLKFGMEIVAGEMATRKTMEFTFSSIEDYQIFLKDLFQN